MKLANKIQQNFSFLLMVLVLKHNYKPKFLNFQKIGLFLALSLLTNTNLVKAQVIPVADTTLTPENSQIFFVGNNNYIIEGGAIRGNNLFHSFSQFNVGEGRGVYFINPSGNIDNIIGRVTGTNVSNILGTLGILNSSFAVDDANLFLINPNGINFGANAQLFLNGSFVASTADGLIFENGFEFKASSPNIPPLMTINIPVGLQFRELARNNNIIQPININGSYLNLADGKTLAFIGGNISVNNGVLLTEEGRIELGGISRSGIVNLNSDLSITIPDHLTRADVSLNNETTAWVMGANNGNIKITANNIDILQGSSLVAGITSNQGQLGNQAGDIILDATGDINVANSSQIRNDVGVNSIGNSGNINIQGESILLTNNSFIRISTFGQGKTGNISITSQDFSLNNFAQIRSSIFGQGNSGNIILNIDNIASLNQSLISNRIEQGGVGDGGDININANALMMSNNSQITASTLGTGNTGLINIITDNQVDLDQSSGILNNISTNAIGNSSGIVINANSLNLNHNSYLTSTTFGQGNGGDIILNIDNIVSLNQSLITNRVEQAGVGNGGDINIEANALMMDNNSQISASSLGKGNTGLIDVTTTNEVNLAQESNILNSIASNAIGNSGGISINANSLSLMNGSSLTSQTFGQGNGGNIDLNIEEKIEINGIGNSGRFSQINNSVATGARGNSGNIDILTNTLIMENQGSIISNTDGQGNAGAIQIQAENISLNGKYTVIANAIGSNALGNSGGLEINTGSLSVTNGSQINSIVLGQGVGGNIKITATNDVIFSSEASDGAPSVLTTSLLPGGFGNAGNIEIIAKSLTIENGGAITSSSIGEGNAGQITVNLSGNLFMRGVGSAGVSSGIYSNLEYGATGNAGNILITANSFQAEEGAAISSNTFSEGNAGNIKLIINEGISFDGVGTNGQGSGIDSRVFFDAEGNGGNIDITSKSLTATNGAQITSSTLGMGNAGNITINSQEHIIFDGIGTDQMPSGLFAIVSEDATGQGGDISLTTNLLSVTNDADINNSTLGEGDAGNLKIEVKHLFVDSFGRIAASTASDLGQGGNIDINATESVNINQGGGIQAQTFADGNAGNVNLQTRQLNLVNGGTISTGTNRNTTGQGGNIDINATQSINISGTITNPNDILPIPSALTTATRGTGNAGNININTPNLTATNGGVIATSTSPESIGNGGNLTANVGILRINGISSEGLIPSALSTDTTGKGNAGNINLNARQIWLENGGLISGSTGGQGKGGTLNINASELINISGTSFNGQPTGILAISGIEGIPRNPLLIDVPLNPANSTGNAGDININTPQLKVENGGRIAVTTQGQGNAGNINLIVANNLTLTGNNTGVFANTTANSTGNGGNIFIDPIAVFINNGAQISVNSQGSGIGGNIDLFAQKLFLDQGTINATTVSNTGGNINLQIVDYILMRHGSLISTTAGSEGGAGTGGNISIDTKFLIAVPFENSDITANSFGGAGGNIKINAQGIFGLGIRSQLTPLSDITAFSLFDPSLNGNIIINTPDIDPSNSLAQLPEAVVDPNQLISQNPCQKGKNSQFIITGRGGIPMTPEQLQGNNIIQVGLISPVINAQITNLNNTLNLEVQNLNQSQSSPAQGWIYNDKNEVILVNYDPTETNVYNRGETINSCPE